MNDDLNLGADMPLDPDIWGCETYGEAFSDAN